MLKELCFHTYKLSAGYWKTYQLKISGSNTSEIFFFAINCFICFSILFWNMKNILKDFKATSGTKNTESMDPEQQKSSSPSEEKSVNFVEVNLGIKNDAYIRDSSDYSDVYTEVSYFFLLTVILL